MSRFVLDASLTMALCYSDEQTPERLTVLRTLDDGEAFVPPHWRVEVGNVLWLGIRKGRIDRPGALAFLERLEMLTITVRQVPVESALGMACDENLTVYDASYLLLAQRTGLPLATLDGDLRKAAGRLGVPVLPH